MQAVCNLCLGIFFRVTEIGKDNIETWQEHTNNLLQQWHVYDTEKQGASILESMSWAQNFKASVQETSASESTNVG